MSMTGLGIRKTMDLAHPAYFSSLFQSEELANVILAKSNLQIFDQRIASMISGYPSELFSPSEDLNKLQCAWDQVNFR